MNPEALGDMVREDLEGVSWARVLTLSSLVVLGFVLGVRFAGVLVTASYGHAGVDGELVRQMKMAMGGGTIATVVLVAVGFGLTYRQD